jgi:SAM-dependent methyltransferase
MRDKSGTEVHFSRITHHASRLIQPELLDHLPETDPSAVRSRRDLRRINWWMGNARKAARAIKANSVQTGPKKFVELGAGDGTFLLRVARLLGPGWKGSHAMLLDRQDLVSSGTRTSLEQLGWQVQTLQADIFEALPLLQEHYDVMLANLFLHHFPASPLQELLRLAAAHSSLLVAVEPRRSVQSLLMSRLLWLIGCNYVTRHDAIVSVRAGFRGDELSSLWPREAGWDCRESGTGLFSHVFVARRNGID